MATSKPAVTLTLAADERKLVDSFDRGAKAGTDMADKIDAASRQVQQAGQRIGDVADHADKAGRSFGDMAGKFDTAGASMVAKAAIIGASVADAFANVFAQANVGGMLAARLDVGAERAAELGRLAGEIYAHNFGESMQDVGEALRGVIGANLVAEDAIDADITRVTEKLLTVGQVMQEETSKVARAVQQMIRTGMVKNAEEGFDLLVRAQKLGLNDAQDLLDTLIEYGTQYRKLGLDAPHALGLIAQSLQGGARDADIAADAIKEFSLRAIKIDDARPGFEALGLSAEKMVKQIAGGGPAATAGLDLVLDRLRALKDPIARDTAATALFGTQWEDLGAALNAMDVTNATDALGRVQGATETAMTAIGDTPTAKFEAFKRNMETSLIQVVNSAMPLLMAFGNFVAQNADVLGPLALAIGVVAVAQWGWNAALNANPIVLIIGLIVGLVAAFVNLWNKSADFRDFFIGIWRGITDAVSAAFNAIPGIVKGGLNGVIWLVNQAVHGINKIIDGVNWVTGWVGIPAIPRIPDIPRLHTGGTVPGPPGSESLILAKAGEHVSAPGQGGPIELLATGSGWFADMLNAAIADGALEARFR